MQIKCKYSSGLGTCIKCKICYPENDESIKDYLKNIFGMIKNICFK
jgi:hypothetical protein